MKAPPTKRLKTLLIPSGRLDVARATEQLLAAQNAKRRRIAARAVSDACSDAQIDDDKKIASSDAVRLLAAMLRASHGEAEAGALALYRLAINTKNLLLIVKEGAIPPLVALLENGTDEAKEIAAAALGNLATIHSNAVSIVSAGAIPPLVGLLENGADYVKEMAATAISCLAFYKDTDVPITRAGAIPSLVALLRDEYGTARAKEMAATALGSLALKNENNKVSIAAAGAIPQLVALLKKGIIDERGVNMLNCLPVAGALKVLSVNKDNRVLIAKAGAIPLLVALLKNDRIVCRESFADSATTTLRNLSYGD